MFLIIFIQPSSREIGTVGGYRILETCERLYLFFIPTFGWNRQYLAVAADGTAYPISKEAAMAIKRGEKQSIDEADLIGPACGTYEGPATGDNGGGFGSGSADRGAEGDAAGSTDRRLLTDDRTAGRDAYPGTRRKKCPYCGFSTTENFTYCPKCAEKLEDERE